VNERARHPERLDDLSVSGPELERTLQELSRLNSWLGNAAAVVRAVRSVAPKMSTVWMSAVVLETSCVQLVSRSNRKDERSD
jgi:hypothetical protein